MKKTRKKNSAKLRFEKMARALTRDLIVVMVNGGTCRVYSKRINKFINPDTALVKSLCEVTYKWAILVSAFGESSTSEKYMKSDLLVASAPYFQSDLSDVATDLHQNLYDNFNKKHFINVGWIADPHGGDVCEKVAGKIFDLLGAWDNKMDMEQVNA